MRIIQVSVWRWIGAPKLHQRPRRRLIDLLEQMGSNCDFAQAYVANRSLEPVYKWKLGFRRKIRMRGAAADFFPSSNDS